MGMLPPSYYGPRILRELESIYHGYTQTPFFFLATHDHQPRSILFLSVTRQVGGIVASQYYYVSRRRLLPFHQSTMLSSASIHTIIFHVRDFPSAPPIFPYIKRIGLTGTGALAPEEYDNALNMSVGSEVKLFIPL